MKIRTFPALVLSLVAQFTSAAQGLLILSVTALDPPSPICGPIGVPASMVALWGGVYTCGSDGNISQAGSRGICPC